VRDCPAGVRYFPRGTSHHDDERDALGEHDLAHWSLLSHRNNAGRVDWVQLMPGGQRPFRASGDCAAFLLLKLSR
jgi:hypothetical protein